MADSSAQGVCEDLLHLRERAGAVLPVPPRVTAEEEMIPSSWHGRGIAAPWDRRGLGRLSARLTTGNTGKKGHGGAGESISIVFCLQGLSDDFHQPVDFPLGREKDSSEGWEGMHPWDTVCHIHSSYQAGFIPFPEHLGMRCWRRGTTFSPLLWG